MYVGVKHSFDALSVCLCQDALTTLRNGSCLLLSPASSFLRNCSARELCLLLLELLAQVAVPV